MAATKKEVKEAPAPKAAPAAKAADTKGKKELTPEQKAAAEQKKAARAAQKYELTENLPNFKKGGQVELIITAMRKLKAATVSEITDAVKGELTTRQEPKQVVAFYITSLKKSGAIKVAA